VLGGIVMGPNDQDLVGGSPLYFGDEIDDHFLVATRRLMTGRSAWIHLPPHRIPGLGEACLNIVNRGVHSVRYIDMPLADRLGQLIDRGPEPVGKPPSLGPTGINRVPVSPQRR
jgi:hypothetical protein